jgi:hypothetical protein
MDDFDGMWPLPGNSASGYGSPAPVIVEAEKILSSPAHLASTAGPKTASAAGACPMQLMRDPGQRMSLTANCAQQLAVEKCVYDAEGRMRGHSRRVDGVVLLFSCTAATGQLRAAANLSNEMCNESTLLALPALEPKEATAILEQLLTAHLEASSRQNLRAGAGHRGIAGPTAGWIALLSRCTVLAHHRLVQLFLPTTSRTTYVYVTARIVCYSLPVGVARGEGGWGW